MCHLRKLEARTVDHVVSAREERWPHRSHAAWPLLGELQSSVSARPGILRMSWLLSIMASLSKIIDVHSHSILAFGESAPVQLATGLV